MNNNNRKRPRIDPIIRLEYENATLRSEKATLQAENTAHQAQDIISQQTIQLAADRLLTIQRRFHLQIQDAMWDEV